MSTARPRPAAAGLTLPFTPARPLFHLHVPKAGGTSVNRLLSQMFPDGGVRWLEHRPGRVGDNHAGLGRHPCYSGHVVYRFRDLLPRGTVVVTFLREPIDRAVSAYYFFRSLGKDVLGQNAVTPGLERCCDLSLGEFLRAEPTAARVNLGNVQTWMFARDRMWFAPPWPDLTRADLAAARANLARCAFVGLTDRLAESVRVLCGMCDWPAPDAPPHLNRTPSRPAADALDAETRGRLEELTALDAELYRLGTDLFADRLRDAPRPALPPAPSRGEVTFDGPVPGHGWFDRESAPDGTHFAWTGREAWLEFRLAGAGGLDLALDVRGAVVPEQLDGLTAEVNGRPVPLLRLRAGEVDRFAGRVDVTAGPGGKYRVVVRVRSAVRPCDALPGSGDPRELGVAVSRVELRFAARAAAARAA